MRILLSGGNGFVGRAVARILAPAHDVLVVDNLRYGAPHIDAATRARIAFETIDICDGPAVENAIDRFAPDAIVHLAAIHYIPECENDPALALRVNLEGSINLMRACPSDARFVLASSGAVYAPSLAPLDEQHSPLAPMDVYGLSKLHAEQYLAYFAQLRDYAAVSVRLFNVVGRGETNPHVLPEIIAQLRAGVRELTLGEISNKRDFIHVNDAAEGFIAAAMAGDIAKGAPVSVNIGTANPYSVAELLGMLETAIGEKIMVVRAAQRLRKIDRPVLCASIEKARRVLGWKPSRTISAALGECLDDPEFAARLPSRLGI
jgi:UDP-glucose 4-epimerase